MYGQTAIEIASNITVRNILLNSMTSKKAVEKGEGYKRTVIDNVVIHNNRADRVKSFMFMAQMQAMKMAPAKEKEKSPKEKEASPTSKAPSSNVRRIRIIEASRKVPASPTHTDSPPNAPMEETKENTKKTTEKNEIDIVTIEDDEDKVGPDDFTVFQLLGKGSFAEVYLVKHKKTNKLFAMKAMSKKRYMSQNLLKYAKTERNVLCFTKHPFIVGMNFAFQTSEKLFMLMDYCPGYIFSLIFEIGAILDELFKRKQDYLKIGLEFMLLKYYSL